MYELILLFFAVAFISIVVGTVAGFGTSTIFLPVALFFLDFQTALVLVAIAHISGNVGAVGFFRKGLDKRLIVLFGLPSIIFTIIGAYLVIFIPPLTLELLLGIFLLIFSVYSLLNPDFKAAATKFNTMIGGSLSGFLQGLLGIGGALRGAFLISYDLDKVKYVATISAIAVIIDAVRIPIYFSNNLLDSQFYYYIPVLVIIGIIGSYVGKRIVSITPQRVFKKIVLVAIAMASLLLIYHGLAG
jgi:uncharacterized membrane protein YfcA